MMVEPRPERPELVAEISKRVPGYVRRNELPPGLTGLAQVNGRNALTWQKKFELDVWYVDNVSLWLDLKILAMTVWKVLRREGISAEGHETMPEFMGAETDD